MKNLKLEYKNIKEHSQNYSFDKKRSNELLKGVKVVLFAAGLSSLNPIPVNAQEELVTQEYVIEEQDSEALEMLKAILIASLIMVSAGTIAAIIGIKKYEKELEYVHPVFLGKLSDENSNDSPEEMVKYLKLTNGLEDRYGKL